ncbi:hypothetical protein JTE90_018739 [Oedothorax gibbosus]|uniref:Uncharacterized protein n=1 Tax=Oedothorax gibbosus TaxID=931172 RepID=A0AAV6TJK3_9ARAC|nr:hypothetical protein JTE90_018739 [Oedothorax gibbosus]
MSSWSDVLARRDGFGTGWISITPRYSTPYPTSFAISRRSIWRASSPFGLLERSSVAGLKKQTTWLRQESLESMRNRSENGGSCRVS